MAAVICVTLCLWRLFLCLCVFDHVVPALPVALPFHLSLLCLSLPVSLYLFPCLCLFSLYLSRFFICLFLTPVSVFVAFVCPSPCLSLPIFPLHCLCVSPSVFPPSLSFVVSVSIWMPVFLSLCLCFSLLPYLFLSSSIFSVSFPVLLSSLSHPQPMEQWYI